MYGSPELKQATVKHFRELMMTKSLIDKALKAQDETSAAVDGMKPHVRLMGGDELARVATSTAAALVDVAYAVNAVEDRLGVLENGK